MQRPAASLEGYADLLREAGRDDEAASLKQRAAALRAKDAAQSATN